MAAIGFVDSDATLDVPLDFQPRGSTRPPPPAPARHESAAPEREREQKEREREQKEREKQEREREHKELERERRRAAAEERRRRAPGQILAWAHRGALVWLASMG